jgi:hypothetical protein
MVTGRTARTSHTKGSNLIQHRFDNNECWSEDILPIALSCIAHIVFDATPLIREPLLCRTQDNDEVEWQGGRVYLHLGARRDDTERR